MSREELGSLQHPFIPQQPPASLPAQPPPSFLSLSALFFPSPSLCWQPSPNKMQRLQQVCPAAASPLPPARSPQTKLLSAAPPGSCHLTLASPAGVRGRKALLPSASLRPGGREGRPPERERGAGRGLPTVLQPSPPRTHPGQVPRTAGLPWSWDPSFRLGLGASLQHPLPRPTGRGLLSPLDR